MRPERRVILLACALLVAACSKSATVKPPKIKGSEQIAPEYSYSDSEATKKRVQVRETLALAGQRFATGDLAEAEKQANKALKLDPTAADAYTLLGAIAARRGQTAQAGGHYRRAAELAPQRGEVLNNYGAWLCANGYPAEALVWFDRALAAPGYRTPGSALANAGGCALKSGQGERAERDLRRALEIEPQNAYALASMAEYQYGQGNTSRRGRSRNAGWRLRRPMHPCYNSRPGSKRGLATGRPPIDMSSGCGRSSRMPRQPEPGKIQSDPRIQREHPR